MVSHKLSRPTESHSNDFPSAKSKPISAVIEAHSCAIEKCENKLHLRVEECSTTVREKRS